MEYLTLGRTLERCRFHFLPQLRDRTQALVLGDGDGRFLASLLQQNPTLRVDAVDISAVMLKLLRDRCQRTAPDVSARLQTHHTDALDFATSASLQTCDLVVTHFFLDCLSQREVEYLTSSFASSLSPRAIWLVSEFCIPTGPARLPAKIFIRGLYLAFQILTGLRASRLPDYPAAFANAGLVRISRSDFLFGTLTTELWTPATNYPTRRL